MSKNKSCGYSVTHVTCGTIKFVLEPLGHLYYALQRMTFSGTASLVLRWTLCEVVKDISFPTCQLLSPDSVRKSYPRGGKLTFSRCLGVGNLPLAYIKMSNSPGSTAHAQMVNQWKLFTGEKCLIGRRATTWLCQIQNGGNTSIVCKKINCSLIWVANAYTDIFRIA